MFKVFKDGQLPTRGSKYSACVDLRAREDIIIGAGETTLIPLGVCIGGLSFDYLTEKFKRRHYFQLMLRSSLSRHLVVANGVGIIDIDYKDEIMIRVHRPVSEPILYADISGAACGLTQDPVYKINKGTRVAQITLLEHKSDLFCIDTEDERAGGFGSTGET